MVLPDISTWNWCGEKYYSFKVGIYSLKNSFISVTKHQLSNIFKFKLLTKLKRIELMYMHWMQVLLRISSNDLAGKLSLTFTMTLQVLQKDISQNRERMIALDKTGTHLKYFSQKQDVILIRNLLSSIQHRWEKIVSRSAERTRHLERGYKEAKQVRANRDTQISVLWYRNILLVIQYREALGMTRFSFAVT